MDDSGARVAIYVRAGSTYTLTAVPDGTYRVLFTAGEEWSGDSAAFSRNARFLEFDRPCTFTASASGYSIWTITPHAVPGGSAQVEPLSPQEFPSLME